MEYSVCMSSTTEREVMKSEGVCENATKYRRQYYCDMSPDEEDLILRLHNLLGDRWSLIAGRIPGRSAEEVERYWKIRTECVHGSSSRKMGILKPVCSRFPPSIEGTPAWLRVKNGCVKHHLFAKH